MIFLLAIGGVVAGVAALAASRSSSPMASPGVTAPALPQQPPAQPAPVQTRQVADGKAAKGIDLGSSAGILAAAGAVAGIVASESAMTKDGKDIAAPVGIGVAAAAYIAVNLAGATVVGVTGVAVAGAAAAAYVVIPVVLVTVAIVTIVDSIMRTIRTDEWKKLVQQIRALREAGKFQEAQALYVTGIEKISEISRTWPQPGDDWYNTADPLGRPYAGFPGLPAPATAADVARWPEMVPLEIAVNEGRTMPVRGLIDALKKDVEEVRAYGLGHGAPGKATINGKQVIVTTGDRDLRGWAPYDTARSNLSGWCAAIAKATPWLSDNALVGYTLTTPAEVAANAAELAAAQAAAEKKQVTRVATTLKVDRATALGLVREEKAAIAAEPKPVAAAHVPAASGTKETGGREPARNNSGSGGRNA